VKDEELFNDETLNQLIQTFSYISVAGIVFSGVAGHCQDTIGSSQTNIITCLIGTAQMIFILSANSEPRMVASFVMYSLFRSFLYPCFFSGLATSFGFKYYGALSGLVLALSGAIFLVGVPVLSGFAIGTCHEAAKKECFHGRWKILHAAQIISLILLLLMEVVYQDGKQSVGYYQKPIEKEKNLEVYNYGSVGGSELVRMSPPTA
jgi:MFS family permease